MRTTRTLSPRILVFLVALAPLAGCAGRPAPVAPAPSAPERLAPAPPAATSAPAVADVVPSPLDGDLLTANEHAYRTGLLGDVYFDYDDDGLRGEARERLAANARFLAEHPEFEVTIEGHCDERGTNDYNLALGERRARSADEYLVSLGLEAGRLSTSSYGEERPLCDGSEEGCWGRNRRAHFVLSGRRPVG